MPEFVVTTSKGLSELLADEIAAICPDASVKVKPGQAVVNAERLDAYRICLWSRLANRVLWPLNQGHIKQADDLYSIASQINWSQHFALETDFVVDFVGTNRTINNSQFGALRIKDAIVDHFSALYEQRPSVNKLDPKFRVQARLWRDQVSIFLDLSGASLHQRHYRLRTGAAPLKEHVASAILMRSGWTKDIDKAIIDPMCGAGTIAIEAALMATQTAPGLNREQWGFEFWKQHNTDEWQQLLKEAKVKITAPTCKIYASDLDRKVLSIAKDNASQAGVFEHIEFNHQDATKIQPKDGVAAGYLVANPPYGERLSELTSLIPLFQKWGEHLKQHYRNWHVSLLTSNRDLLRQLKLFADKDYKLMNGALECQLVNFAITGKNLQAKQQASANNEFANRLRKNLKGLNKWLKQQHTNCYRMYDADLPEYNVAIDRYADYLVVQEYAAPKNIPEQKTKKRLHEVLLQLPVVTGVEPKNIVLKVREQQKGKKQYEKVGKQDKHILVQENHASLQVNLWDYLDTGLFLDHRNTRQIVRSLSHNKDVLNLFAYTGSVSVFAALGGARSVTTVDMSNTYLNWAKDNFRLNKLRGAYEFVQADCLTWLSQHTQKYDLIFIDPPSFSNSKRMQNTWDVQRDHIQLLSDARKCLTENGTVIFSNNLRQFKLDHKGVENLGFEVEDIKNKTLPEDFKRNTKIHHCWKLTAR